ncbi:MAG: dTMP kinase [Spirochaetaceae bacterium]|jgi:dTMP kinase|nr:dTMP kinase [Spirochaetaceae bacterium]
MILQNFAVFEGCDGAGTTTQREILRMRLENEGVGGRAGTVFDTFEPTDGAIGKLLRSALSNSRQFTGETMAYLFAADRNEHIFGKNGILERCKRGEITICDRYVLSSLAYQGLVCGDELPERLNKDFPAPELLLFFDIDPEIAFKRIESRGKKKEIYEYIDFQIKVRESYKKLLPQCVQNGSIVELINADAPVEELAKKVWSSVQKMTMFRRGS